MKLSNAVLFGLVLVLGACAPATVEESSEIVARSEAWQEAMNSGDVDGVVAMYTEDARILAPGSAMSQGSEAVREAFAGMVEAGLQVELGTVEALASGDLGHRVGTYELTADGELVERGKFVETWRKVGGEWKISNDIWNADAEPGGATETVVFTHRVEDPAVWLAAWQGEDGRRADFAAHGAPAVRVFQSPDDPALTGLLVELEDEGAFNSWLESDEGRSAATADTVVLETITALGEVE